MTKNEFQRKASSQNIFWFKEVFEEFKFLFARDFEKLHFKNHLPKAQHDGRSLKCAVFMYFT